MTADQFTALVLQARARQDRLLDVKGADYTRKNADRLWNFKQTAREVGITPLQCWAVYAGKHWNSIMAYVQTGKVESEAIEGRLDDLSNYLFLLEGLLQETLPIPRLEFPVAADHIHRYRASSKDPLAGICCACGFRIKTEVGTGGIDG